MLFLLAAAAVYNVVVINIDVVVEDAVVYGHVL
jgi:hypothetical protein